MRPPCHQTRKVSIVRTDTCTTCGRHPAPPWRSVRAPAPGSFPQESDFQSRPFCGQYSTSKARPLNGILATRNSAPGEICGAGGFGVVPTHFSSWQPFVIHRHPSSMAALLRIGSGGIRGREDREILFRCHGLTRFCLSADKRGGLTGFQSGEKIAGRVKEFGEEPSASVRWSWLSCAGILVPCHD